MVLKSFLLLISLLLCTTCPVFFNYYFLIRYGSLAVAHRNSKTHIYPVKR